MINSIKSSIAVSSGLKPVTYPISIKSLSKFALDKKSFAESPVPCKLGTLFIVTFGSVDPELSVSVLVLLEQLTNTSKANKRTTGKLFS
ncbi:hypothetical protein M601_018805 [Cellulophaga baltica 4]|nr:hypothetical protein M601_018805 [Cellulophaga baltica 4]